MLQNEHHFDVYRTSTRDHIETSQGMKAFESFLKSFCFINFDNFIVYSYQ